MTLASEPKRSQPTVIFYGGTFDPPHRGHLLMVEKLLKAWPRMRVWISVAPAPAGAAQQHKAPGATYAERLDMCRMNFATLLMQGNVELTDVETQLPAPNYTVTTLQHCAGHFPGETWGFLMGQDQLEAFASWREPRLIAQLADLVVVSRGQQRSLEEALLSVAQKLGLAIQQEGPETWLWPELGTRVYLLPGAVSDAASRDVRKDPDLFLKKDWLVPEVASYIQAHGIYRK